MTYREFLEGKIDVAPLSGLDVGEDELNPILKPHQRASVLWALFFLDELKRYLQAFGCTDIQGHMEIVKDADPPWMDCRFVAHGKMPDERPEEAYKDGRLRKYLRDQVYRFCTHCGPTREQVEKLRGEVNKVDKFLYACSKCGAFIDKGDSFCCRCGVPLTDRAVDIIMKRLEELKDEVD